MVDPAHAKIEIFPDNSVRVVEKRKPWAAGALSVLWELTQHTVVVRESYPNPPAGKLPALDMFRVYSVLSIDYDQNDTAHIEAYPVTSFCVELPTSVQRRPDAAPAAVLSGEDNKPDAWDTWAAQNPAPKEA